MKLIARHPWRYECMRLVVETTKLVASNSVLLLVSHYYEILEAIDMSAVRKGVAGKRPVLDVW